MHFRQLANTLTTVILILSFVIMHGHSAAARSTPEQQVYIRVNQLGFGPRDVKIAIAFAGAPLPDSFQVVNAITKKVAFTGNTIPIAGVWGQFDHHAELNFTTLQKEGRYFIQLVLRSPYGSVSYSAFQTVIKATHSIGDEVKHRPRKGPPRRQPHTPENAT